MTVPSPPTVGTAPSPAPTTTDTVNFDARADAFHAFFPNWLNNLFPAVLAWIKARADAMEVQATDAEAAAAAAQSSAVAAATSANAPAWVSGKTYAVGDVAYSTLAKTTYRRLVAGAGTADPSTDPANWEPCGASLIAQPGRTPLADAMGKLHPSWYASSLPFAPVNDIGVAGFAGFGVGVCPSLPAGCSPLAGNTDRFNDNYGNYAFSDGSISVWIPAYYMRIGHPDNATYATYGVNSISIAPLSAFVDETTANASGYYLHRAFVNAGVNQQGFFRDKYDCSLNGTVASSIKGVQPMVSGPVAGQVGFTGATANGQTPTNTYGGAIAAARSRGSKWHPETVYQADALTRISEAHAQASSSTQYCAWYSAGNTNFPKGNNSNTLRDVNDSTVQFTSAGNATYPAFALSGSGVPFAKTTHNGQACGVSDVAGNIYKINPGLTCVATSKAITGATQTSPVRITATAHGFTTGMPALIESVGGMTVLNSRLYTITVIDANTISLDGVDGTAFAAYTSGGSITAGRFYALKKSANIETLTAGNTLATDLWGAAGVAANYDEITLNFATQHPNNGIGQRYGNADAQVFSWGTEADRLRSMAGLPAAGGTSAAGTALMGNDYFYQYVRNELCVISRSPWRYGSPAGSRFRGLATSRTDADSSVGFAASRYL